MTYLLQTNRKKSSKFFYAKLLFFALFAVGVVFVFKKPLVFLTAKTSYPFALAKESSFGLWLSSKKALIEEIALLKEDNQKFALELKPTEEEKVATSSTKKGVDASVLLSMGNGPFDTIKIKTNEPLSLGQKVKAGNIYIGEVADVSGLVSFVKLYSTQGQSLKGFFGKKQIQIEARGLGGGAFEILIPKGMEVSVGEGFFLGEEKHLIATTQRIFESPEETFTLVYASLPVNPFEIREVFIEK